MICKLFTSHRAKINMICELFTSNNNNNNIYLNNTYLKSNIQCI